MIGKFIRDENGATALEYGLIGMIISLAVLFGASNIGGYIQSSYQNTMMKVQESADQHVP